MGGANVNTPKTGIMPPNSDCHARTGLSHRYIKVVSYGIAVTLTSCIYAGWQQYSLLLLRGGKYSWLCTGGDVTESESGILTCPAQERAVGYMFPLASGSELFGAIFAGVALDYMGPRITGFFGEVLGFGAILMIMLSNEKTNMLPAAMVLTGIAINLVAFPALILEDYFPSAAATTAAYVVSCQALSCIIAPILWVLWRSFPHWTFNGIWTVYLLALWIPSTIFYLICLPKHRSILPVQVSMHPVVVDASSPIQIPSASHPEGSRLVLQLNEPALRSPHAVEEAITISPHDPGARKVALKAFFRACLSRQFLALNVVNMVLMVQTAYYQIIVRNESGVKVAAFVGWAMPSQAIWGILLGRIVDYIATPAMCIVLLLGYSATYLLLMAGRSWIQYITGTLFVVTMSYAFTVKYSYIQETFPPNFYGTLVGIAGCVSGISVLLTDILTTTMTVRLWSFVLSIMSIFTIPVTVWMWRAAKLCGGLKKGVGEALVSGDDEREVVVSSGANMASIEIKKRYSTKFMDFSQDFLPLTIRLLHSQ